MKTKYLEAGKIVSTHGVAGEVKIEPWCDSAEFLRQFSTFYISGKPYHAVSSRVHKGMLLCKFQEVPDLTAAQALKDKVLKIDRNDAAIPEGRVFIADLIGLPVYEGERKLGILKNVEVRPANDVFVVSDRKDGVENEYLIPAISEFLEEINVDGGYIRVRLISGMGPDDDAD